MDWWSENKTTTTTTTKDQDREVCALKLESTSLNSHIMAVYRAPMGKFNFFLKRLRGIIKKAFL